MSDSQTSAAPPDEWPGLAGYARQCAAGIWTLWTSYFRSRPAQECGSFTVLGDRHSNPRAEVKEGIQAALARAEADGWLLHNKYSMGWNRPDYSYPTGADAVCSGQYTFIRCREDSK